MNKPRRDERRSARDMKSYENLNRIVSDTARPLLERVCVHELYANKTPEPLHINAMSKENEGN